MAPGEGIDPEPERWRDHDRRPERRMRQEDRTEQRPRAVPGQEVVADPEVLGLVEGLVEGRQGEDQAEEDGDRPCDGDERETALERGDRCHVAPSYRAGNRNARRNRRSVVTATDASTSADTFGPGPLRARRTIRSGAGRPIEGYPRVSKFAGRSGGGYPQVCQRWSRRPGQSASRGHPAAPSRSGSPSADVGRRSAVVDASGTDRQVEADPDAGTADRRVKPMVVDGGGRGQR